MDKITEVKAELFDVIYSIEQLSRRRDKLYNKLASLQKEAEQHEEPNNGSEENKQSQSRS